MSREQSNRLDALFRERMSGTIAENWWQSEMCWDEENQEIPESAEEQIINNLKFLPKLRITKAGEDTWNMKETTSDIDENEIYSDASRRSSFSSDCSFTTNRYALVPYPHPINSGRKSFENYSRVSSGYNSVYSSLTSLN